MKARSLGNGQAKPPVPPNTHVQEFGESGFKGQLQDALEERKPRSAMKDTKQDIPPPTIAVVVVPPTVPPPPPVGSFGFPSAGVEAGTADKAPAAELAPIEKPTVEISAITLPKPTAEIIPPDAKTGLAFALRLTDLTPNREVHLEEKAQQPAPQETEPIVALPANVPQVPTTSQPATDIVTTAVPIKLSQPAQQTSMAGTPVIAIAAPKQQDSGSHPSEGGAPGKETPKQAQPQQAADTKSFRVASATPEIVSSASRETPLQTPAVTLTAATSTPLTPPAPEHSSPVAAATSIEAVSIPLAAPKATSHVTDVSVNIQVPRADASGDDRVAIRMLQRGSEIHVSVRTPDSQLAQSLRQDLGKLTTGLDQGGFRTETWRPTAVNSGAQTNTSPQHQPQPDSSNRDGGSNNRSGGNSGQGSGEQKRRQQDERPRWVAELEQQKNQ
jgi:hypothetical protein